MPMYAGINGTVTEIPAWYAGINGAVHQITKFPVGINGTVYTINLGSGITITIVEQNECTKGNTTLDTDSFESAVPDLISRAIINNVVYTAIDHQKVNGTYQSNINVEQGIEIEIDARCGFTEAKTPVTLNGETIYESAEKEDNENLVKLKTNGDITITFRLTGKYPSIMEGVGRVYTGDQFVNVTGNAEVVSLPST